MPNARVRRSLLALLAAAPLAGGALAACDRAPAGSLATADSVKALSERLQAAEQGVRQRDQLMGELAQTARLVREIDSSLATVKGIDGKRSRVRGGADADPWVARRDSVMARVEAVTQLLAQSRARVAELEKRNRSLGSTAADYRATIAQLQATVSRQEQELAALSATADSLRTVGTQYASERDAARDTLTTTRDAANTVYWVVGRRRELIDRRIVSEEGARRFLVAGRRTALVPARGLDPQATGTLLHSGDQRREIVIALPEPQREWRVVSRHDPALLVPGKRPDGTPDGTLRVTDPARFWSASRYLIIAQN